MVHLRMLYNYAVAIRRSRDDGARRALTTEYERQRRFLADNFWDKQNGGWYVELHRDGTVKDASKPMIGQAYAIYILAELHLMLHDTSARELAEKTFTLVDRNAHDAQHGGYYERFSPSPESLTETDKFVSTNMNMAFALATLIRGGETPVHRQRAEELLAILTRHTIAPHSGNGYYVLARNWEPIVPARGLSNKTLHGHNAELVWYMLEVSDALGKDRNDIRGWALNLAGAFEKNGVDPCGAVYGFGQVDGPVDNKDEIAWWSQCEAMILFLKLYQWVGTPSYLDYFERVKHWTLQHMTPDQSGAWLSIVDRNGRPVADYRGGEGWKADQHVVRMVLELEHTLDLMQVGPDFVNPPGKLR
jgi:mannobiose 2-epimerase